MVYVDHSEHVHMIANTNFIIEIPLHFFIMILKVFLWYKLLFIFLNFKWCEMS